VVDSHKREHTLITLLLLAAHEMIDELVERLAGAGYPDIRPAHSRVFENIDGDGTRLTVLADRARMTHPSMSELVNGLQGLGYVERVPDPEDGRARLVRLTPAGRALQRVALREIAKIEAAWSARLGPEVGPALSPALTRVLGSASRLPKPPVRQGAP
jgi:DNA-binding MarR family transcriptional regulator